MSEKQGQVERFLGDVLGKMGFAARVEVKVLDERPAQDGQPAVPSSISVALFPEGELPGLTAGKRTPVVESLQFLANKVVNRGPEKQWVNLGVGGHPEPRVPGQKKERPPKEREPQKPREGREGREAQREAPSPSAAAPASSPAAAPRSEKKRGRRDGREPREESAGPREGAPAAARVRETDEASLASSLPEDPVMTALGRALAQKSAELGRIYAVTAVGAEDRARLLKAAEQVDFVRGKVEGEGRHRRVVFMPANPKPMPKKSHIPDYDDEDEDDAEE